MKLRELELELKTEFEAGGFEDPGYEARQVLAAMLGVSSGSLLQRDNQEVDEAALKQARHWAGERLRGVPLAYLSGSKGFYKNEFFVEPGVLVPRPESEHVIEVALRRAAETQLRIQRIADLGCGTGILGLSLLVEIPSASLVAVDASAIAARVTRKNGEKLGVVGRFEVLEKPVEEVVLKFHFELIVANPPYIAHGDANVQRSVHEQEPHEALYADENGLGAIRRWSFWASNHLQRGGLFVCEIGAGQSADVQDILGKLNFTEIRVDNDLAGHARIVSAIKSEG